jgi:DNA-binding Lrp family transcriptional regulator
MIRETSIEAYEYLVDSGTLAEMNRIVYKHLWHHGPTTQKKTERYYNDRTYTLRPRFAQLEKMGLIKSIGSEPCEETGRKNLLWDVTDRVFPINSESEAKSRREELLHKISEVYHSMQKDLFCQQYMPGIKEIFQLANLIAGHKDPEWSLKWAKELYRKNKEES